MKLVVRTFMRCMCVLLALPLLAAGAGAFVLWGVGPARAAGIRVTVLERVAAAKPVLSALTPELLPWVAGGLIALATVLIVAAVWPRRPRAAKSKRPKKQAKQGKRETAVPAVAESAAAVPRPPRREAKKLLKQAHGIEAKQGPEEAGQFLLGYGMRDEAADLFARADLPERLAEVRHDQNRFEESAELYEQAGRFEAAGAIWARLERFGDAARCYLQAEKRSVAGEMYEKAGNFGEAGRCYREIGFCRHAAQAFLKGNLEAEAAEALVAAFNEESAGARGENEHKARELAGMGRKAGELYLKLGQLEEAEAILVRSGAFAHAAKVAMKLGAFDRAADLFQRVGRGDLAAEALERAGDRAAAARVRAEHVRAEGDEARAADLFAEAGEHQEAADLYRKVEQYARAGECYEQAQDNAAAAEMFQIADLPERASQAFERCGQFERAAEQAERAGNQLRYAELLERAGHVLRAARIYADEGQVDQSIRMLQRIEPGSEGFVEACGLLGRLFQAKGMHSLSIKKLEQAAGGGDVTRANVDAYFDLGQVLETRGDLTRAVEIYEKILSFDYHHADVASRLELAKEQLGRLGTGGPETGTNSRGTPGGAGRYQILRELGRGGMAVVYLARDTVLDRDVAFKVLPEGLRSSPSALRNFFREAKAAAQLNHPHIVTVYDAGESEHGFYLAMEYVDGTTLKQIVQSRGAISPQAALYVLRQMAAALDYAHSKKVVHRDVKTANTMWTRDKKVKIMDFGLAKLMEEVRNATTLVSGTPFYMSPEQTLGRNVDHRTDIYSLGVTAFELATGQLPFRKGNVPYHHVHTPAPDPREINGQVPEELARAILACLEKDPARRYQSARELKADLERVSS